MGQIASAGRRASSDLGHHGAALSAELLLGALVALAVEGCLLACMVARSELAPFSLTPLGNAAMAASWVCSRSELNAAAAVVVGPRGVEHCPRSDEGASMLLTSQKERRTPATPKSSPADELTLRLGEEDLVSVVVADDSRRPGLVERRERRREVDLPRCWSCGMFMSGH
jgi:hypothetical protein